jgi:hypothetical protein
VIDDHDVARDADFVAVGCVIVEPDRGDHPGLARIGDIDDRRAEMIGLGMWPT